MAVEPKLQPPVLDGASLAPFTLRDLLVYFLRLGTLGFGGPIALAVYMQRALVEGRRWVSKQDYLEGLAFSQLSPGPLAAQLAMYLGWLRAGAFGATLVGIAFILPSFLMVLVLAALYVHYGNLPWISRHVLRDWSRGHCDHCAKRNQTGPHHGRERLAPLGNLWIDRPNH